MMCDYTRKPALEISGQITYCLNLDILLFSFQGDAFLFLNRSNPISSPSPLIDGL